MSKEFATEEHGTIQWRECLERENAGDVSKETASRSASRGLPLRRGRQNRKLEQDVPARSSLEFEWERDEMFALS